MIQLRKVELSEHEVREALAEYVGKRINDFRESVVTTRLRYKKGEFTATVEVPSNEQYSA